MKNPLDISNPSTGDNSTQETEIKNDAGNPIGVSVASPSSIGVGFKNVTTAGTRVTLVASSTPCKSVTITAKTTNTGYIAVGGSTIDASAGGNGVYLAPGDSFSIDIADLNVIYIDSTVNGEGVRYTYTL